MPWASVVYNSINYHINGFKGYVSKETVVMCW